MRDSPDAVPLRTSLRQGNGKNLCRITVLPDLLEFTPEPFFLQHRVVRIDYTGLRCDQDKEGN